YVLLRRRLALRQQPPHHCQGSNNRSDAHNSGKQHPSLYLFRELFGCVGSVRRPVGLIRIGFQDVRYATAQLTKLLLQSLELCVVGFCGYVARQLVQIIEGETIKRPTAGARHNAQTVGEVAVSEGVVDDQVALTLGQFQRNLFPDGDMLPMLHWTFTDSLGIISPFHVPGFGEQRCGRPGCGEPKTSADFVLREARFYGLLTRAVFAWPPSIPFGQTRFIIRQPVAVARGNSRASTTPGWRAVPDDAAEAPSGN